MKGYFESMNRYQRQVEGLEALKERLPAGQYKKLKYEIARDIFENVELHKYKEDIYKGEYLNNNK